MNASNPTISVVYIAYIPLGIKPLQLFIKSYKEYESGIDHELIIVFKGFQELSEIQLFEDTLILNEIKFTPFKTNENLDIGSYFFVAQQLSSDYILYLNTNSELLSSNWLRKLFKAINDDRIGLVGCTGSWGAFGRDNGRTWQVCKDLFINLFIGKTTIHNSSVVQQPPVVRSGFLNRIFVYYLRKINFRSRENPHVRTNAFMINRMTFLSLKYHNPRPQLFFKWWNKNVDTRFKTICFEHGINSMSMQIWKKNLEILVVDKNGNTYKRSQWKESSTFWYGSQENLLISDNQTQFYQNANEIEKASRRYSAWNEI